MVPSRTASASRDGFQSASDREGSPENQLPGSVDSRVNDRAEFDAAIARLRALSEALRAGQPESGPRAVALLEALETELLFRFAAEKIEEFVGALLTKQPRLLRRSERLEAEHAKIGDAIEQLVRFARRAPASVDLSERITRFLDGLERHERAENALMHEFLLLDEGGSD